MKRIITYLTLGLIVMQGGIFTYALLNYLAEAQTVYIVVMVAMFIAVIGTVMMLADGLKRGVLKIK